MDNFFKSIGLFQDLASRQIYAIGIVRLNWIGLPLASKNMSILVNVSYGNLEWRMHQSCQMASVLWKDKKHVLLFPILQFPLVILACQCLRCLEGTAQCERIS